MLSSSSSDSMPMGFCRKRSSRGRLSSYSITRTSTPSFTYSSCGSFTGGRINNLLASPWGKWKRSECSSTSKSPSPGFHTSTKVRFKKDIIPGHLFIYLSKIIQYNISLSNKSMCTSAFRSFSAAVSANTRFRYTWISPACQLGGIVMLV